MGNKITDFSTKHNYGQEQIYFKNAIQNLMTPIRLEYKKLINCIQKH